MHHRVHGLGPRFRAPVFGHQDTEALHTGVVPRRGRGHPELRGHVPREAPEDCHVGDVLDVCFGVDVGKDAVPHAVPGPREGDEVAALRGVDEDLAPEEEGTEVPFPRHRHQAVSLHVGGDHPGFQKELHPPRALGAPALGLGEKVVQDLLSHGRFTGDGVRPPVTGVHRAPQSLVVGHDAPEDLAVEAAAVPPHVVHGGNGAGGELPTDPGGFLHQGYVHAHAGGGNGGGASPRPRSHHHHVVQSRGLRRKGHGPLHSGHQKKEQCQNCHDPTHTMSSSR